MRTEVNGVILRETNLGENDKIINILTGERGLVSAIIKNSKNIRNKNSAGAQQFAYCRFVLYAGKKGYIVDEIQIQELFFELRNDLETLSLAQYFSELCLTLSPEGKNVKDFLKLFLNSIAYLINKKKSHTMIKSIFEMKSCSISGYMPNLVSCHECKIYESDIIYFLITQGILICSSCIKNHQYEKTSNNNFALKKSIVAALRHIIYSPIEKIFSFSVSEESLTALSEVCEKYVTGHISSNFKSLNFYKKLTHL